MRILKNKKRFFKIFISVSAVFFLLFAIVYFVNLKIELAEKALAKTNLSVFNTGCIIRTLGQNTESVSANISFFTPNTSLISSYERSWQGWELKIECIVFPLKNGVLVFPHRIFSNRTKFGTGVILFKLYNNSGYPAIYDYAFLSREEKKAIKTLFKLAKFSPSLFKIFSTAKAQTIDLREFKPDQEFLLFTNSEKQLYLKKN